MLERSVAKGDEFIKHEFAREPEWWHNIKTALAELGTTPNTGSPELPPEIVESFYEFCVNGGWNKETYDMLDAVFTFCTRRQLRVSA